MGCFHLVVMAEDTPDSGTDATDTSDSDPVTETSTPAAETNNNANTAAASGRTIVAGEKDANGNVNYEVNQSAANETTGRQTTTATYTFDNDAAAVSVIAWHHEPDGASLAKSAAMMTLPGGSGVKLNLLDFSDGSVQGYVVFVIKAKPGYLVTGLVSDGRSGNFYPIRKDASGNYPFRTISYYAGLTSVGEDAESLGYEVLFGYSRKAARDFSFEIQTQKVGVSVEAEDVSNVKVGDTITLTTAINPVPQIQTDNRSLSISLTSLSATINDTPVSFTDAGSDESEYGPWTRTVQYTVRPEDVSDGTLKFRVSAGLHYTFTFTVNSGVSITSTADTTGEAEKDIAVTSDTIVIKGEDTSVTYDSQEHSSASAIINGQYPVDENGEADITLNKIVYHLSGIKTEVEKTADGTGPVNVGTYAIRVDTSNVVVTSDGKTVSDQVIKVEGEAGTLEITPASMAMASIDNPVYNSEEQKLKPTVYDAASETSGTSGAAGSAKANVSFLTRAVLPQLTSSQTVLEEGRDYTLSYASDLNNDYTNAGRTITVTATGTGNYTGSVSTTYTIQPRAIRVGTNSASKTYDGKPLTASGSIDNAIAKDGLKLILTGSQTSVGSSANTYEIDYGSEAMKNNYKVAGETIGTLTVYAQETKPGGRTCQQDGYPAGYNWDDAKQACVLAASETSPSIKWIPRTSAQDNN